MSNKYLDTQIEGVKSQIRGLQKELGSLEKLQSEAKDKKGIESWIGFSFESSTGLTKEFSAFARDFKKYLKASLSENLELAEFSKGHFEVYGFIQNKVTGRFAYFSVSDVRYWSDSWYNNILVRTAKDTKDYSGGSNGSYKFPEIGKVLEKLTRGV